MAKTWDELAAGGYPAVLPEVCDHEQRIADLERRVAAIEAQLAQEDAAWLDEMAARIVACGMRRQ